MIEIVVEDPDGRPRNIPMFVCDMCRNPVHIDDPDATVMWGEQRTMPGVRRVTAIYVAHGRCSTGLAEWVADLKPAGQGWSGYAWSESLDEFIRRLFTYHDNPQRLHGGLWIGQPAYGTWV